MNTHAELAKLLILMGAVICLVGLIVLFAPGIPWLGRLPGDLDIRGKNYRVFIPIITCILASVVLTLLLNLFNLFRR